VERIILEVFVIEFTITNSVEVSQFNIKFLDNMSYAVKIFSVSVAVLFIMIILTFVFTQSVFADAGHSADEPHGTGNEALSNTVDRSGQLPSVILGFVIGLVVGAIAVKFFTKSA